MDFRLSDEQEMFRKSVRDYVNRELPKSWARDLEKDEHTFPHELFGKLATAGFHAIGIPEEYGGQGGDIMTQMLLARELARSLAGLTWVWGITSFAGGKSVGIYGTPEQKQQHLPAIAAGREKWAIGFTEPGGGTDVLGAMRTVATRADGGWVINGQKTWSSMAHVADYILLLVRTTKDVAKQYQGVSLFILPTASDGVTIREIPKLGMRALGSCDVFLDDVFVADENLLGQPDQAWKMLLPTLNNERIMLSAFCVGILDGVLEDALRYVTEREAFGRKIGEFQALQHYIANVAMWQEQADLIVTKAAWLQSRGLPCQREATMAKVIASELANQAADLGIQILGGMGYSAETDMQRYWRDSRLFRIGPITNEMARNSIAEGLGLPRSFDGVVLMGLAGHQLPPGSARLEPYQNWLLHDAVYSPPRPEPHPVAAFVLANRGIGISLADLFRLFGSDIDDGPLLAESSIELHRPLAEDTDYEVRGVVESVKRRRSRRIGPFDRITCRFDLFAGGAPAATVTNVFAVPRPVEDDAS